jgi:hypothetical protein
MLRTISDAGYRLAYPNQNDRSVRRNGQFMPPAKQAPSSSVRMPELGASLPTDTKGGREVSKDLLFRWTLLE